MLGERMLQNCPDDSVQLNDIFIPKKSVKGVIGEYAHPLAVWNHRETYTVGLIGSCIGIYYRSKYLLLCTRHQLKALDGRSYKDVGLLDTKSHTFCSAAGIKRHPDHLNEVDLHDLAVFDFTEQCQDKPHMREHFFRLIYTPPETPQDQSARFITFEYPSKEQGYDLEENRLELRRFEVNCSLTKHIDQSKQDPTILNLTPLNQLSFNPDGMSGGPAFAIQYMDGIPHVYLAGMTVRGGSNNLYILKISFIRKFLDFWQD